MNRKQLLDEFRAALRRWLDGHGNLAEVKAAQQKILESIGWGKR